MLVRTIKADGECRLVPVGYDLWDMVRAFNVLASHGLSAAFDSEEQARASAIAYGFECVTVH